MDALETDREEHPTVVLVRVVVYQQWRLVSQMSAIFAFFLGLQPATCLVYHPLCMTHYPVVPCYLVGVLDVQHSCEHRIKPQRLCEIKTRHRLLNPDVSRSTN